jgi:hypothetical protein
LRTAGVDNLHLWFNAKDFSFIRVYKFIIIIIIKRLNVMSNILQCIRNLLMHAIGKNAEVSEKLAKFIKNLYILKINFQRRYQFFVGIILV